MEEKENKKYLAHEMDFEDEYYDEEESSIDIGKYVRKVACGWKKLLAAAGVGVVIGLVLAFTTPKTFTSSATLSPELNTRSGSGNLSSLAALAGVNLNSASSSSTINPSLYPQIVASNPFVVELFSIPVEIKKGHETVSTDYYTYLKKYQKGSLIGAVLGFPGKAIGWCLGLFKKKEPKDEGYANVDPLALNHEQEGIVKSIRKAVSADVDKKNYVTTISVSAQDAAIAKQVTDSVISKLGQYVSNYTTGKSREDLEYYQKLCNEAQADYYNAQQTYARYIDANQGIVLNSRKTEAERLQNEMQLKFNLYNACAQQVQQAQAAVQREKPVFSIVDPASIPLKPSSMSKSKTLLIWMVIAVFFEAAYLCLEDPLKSFWKQLKGESPEE